jgi:hypothetical protein
VRLCKYALASGLKSTKELALRYGMGLDTGDEPLTRAMATRMIHALRQQWRLGDLDGEEKVQGSRVRALKSDHLFVNEPDNGTDAAYTC